MENIIFNYLSVIVGSSLKFILGPVFGVAEGLSYLEVSILTIIGAMSSVIIVCAIGVPIRDYFKNKRKRKRKVFTKANRRIVRIWSRFGINGVAFFTPLILTPIGGTLIAIAFGVKTKVIITRMFFGISIWSFILTALVLAANKGLIELDLF